MHGINLLKKLLGRFGESLYYLRTKIYGNCMVAIEAALQQRIIV
jgi:hypothetical protein